MGQLPFSTGFSLPYSDTSVALVDDDTLLRDALSRLLEMTGMTVEQYDSGADFLAAAETSQVDCLVLDVHLGDLSGIEVARKLQESQSQIPIVFITGSIDPVFEQQAEEVGCAGFLRKPFLRDSLIDAIAAAIADRENSDSSSLDDRPYEGER